LSEDFQVKRSEKVRGSKEKCILCNSFRELVQSGRKMKKNKRSRKIMENISNKAMVLNASKQRDHIISPKSTL